MAIRNKQRKVHGVFLEYRIEKQKPYAGEIASTLDLIWFFVDGVKTGIKQSQLEKKLQQWKNEGKRVQKIGQE